MNNPYRAALAVGVFVVIAAVLFVAGWAFFNQQLRRDDTYGLAVRFNDAQGIGRQANVYLAGVKIGEVTGVDLSPDGRSARVHLQIAKKYHIPQGSAATIAASLLGGAATLDFTPPAQTRGPVTDYPPGTLIQGTSSASFADLQAKAGGLMSRFGQTAAKANQLLDAATKTAALLNKMVSNPKLSGSLDDTVENLDAASQQGLALTHQLGTMLAQDNSEVHDSLGNVNQTTESLRQVTAANTGQLNRIVANLDQTTTQLAHLSDQANQTLTQGRTMQNLSDMVANLKEASAKLNSIEDNISTLTSDPKLRADLKTTVHNAAVASTNTRVLVQRLTALTGGGAKPAGQGQLNFVSRLDFTQNLRTNNFRTDFDLFAPLSSIDFARIGVYDLTGKNELNLQYGEVSPYNRLLTYRAGIYASKVGIGADYDLFGARTFSVELYDPNRIRLDARQKFPLNKNSSVWVGVDDVPRTNAITLGFELQR